MLPTNKPHISFSEAKDWIECSWRHKLKFVDKVGEFTPGPAMSFGTACHASGEHFLKTRVMDVSLAHAVIDSEWAAHSVKFAHKGFTPAALEQAHKDADTIMNEVPAFIEATFPQWEYVSAEQNLYEPIVGHDDVSFKGFIDGIIKCKGKRGEDLKWIIDWKTTARGWFREKREDFTTKMQLILYKNFWSIKQNEEMKDVRCAFILLKKSGKPGEHCEFLPVSVGPVTVERSLKVINNMIGSVKRGMALKNRDSCKYCDFRETPHCP